MNKDKPVHTPLSVRPTELRYRLADFINDRIHALPIIHQGLKSVFKSLGPSKTVTPKLEAFESVAPLPAEPEPVPPERTDEPVPISSISLEALPYPPLEMRQLVGPTDLSAFDNPDGKLVFNYVEFLQEPAVYERVFDFGCGCGRIARQLMLQRPTPQRYVGIDLHAGMIRWCQRNLQPAGLPFTFLHHNVYNANFNREPIDRWTAPFPGWSLRVQPGDRAFRIHALNGRSGGLLPSGMCPNLGRRRDLVFLVVSVRQTRLPRHARAR